jgi:iron complex transport system ATP-binding protein
MEGAPPMVVMTARGVTVDRRLRDVDLELRGGEVTGLIGPNGAGKSTLLHALAGIQRCGGRIDLDGKDLGSLAAGERARRISLQPQFVSSAWSLCVSDIVSFGRIPWGDMDQRIIGESMRVAGVDGLATRRVDELSGGERARVWLARVLAGRADVLLMDEPVASLDIHYQHEVMRVLSSHAKSGHAVMIAIHDLSLAARYCDSLCLLEDAGLVSTGSVDEVLNEPLLARVFRADIHVDLKANPPVVLSR